MTKTQSKLTNSQAAELFNTLNGLKPTAGSKLEYAVVRTLRSMKAWQQQYAEVVEDINTDCATTYENDKGVKLILKDTLKRTRKSKGGEDITEEFQVVQYSPEDEKKRLKKVRDYDKKEVTLDFVIHQTDDSATLSAYQCEVLAELGFLKQTKSKD